MNKILDQFTLRKMEMGNVGKNEKINFIYKYLIPVYIFKQTYYLIFGNNSVLFFVSYFNTAGLSHSNLKTNFTIHFFSQLYLPFFHVFSVSDTVLSLLITASYSCIILPSFIGLWLLDILKSSSPNIITVLISIFLSPFSQFQYSIVVPSCCLGRITYCHSFLKFWFYLKTRLLPLCINLILFYTSSILPSIYKFRSW